MMAELPPAEKNRISHRGLAAAQAVASLTTGRHTADRMLLSAVRRV
jgi:hypothetical protein